MSQARSRWGEDIGRGFLTLWNNIIILPGIRDRETLETLSMLIGDYDRPVWGRSWPSEKDVSATYESWTLNYNRQPIVPPSEISQGHPQSPDIALAFVHQQLPMRLYVTPYYRSPPWTHAIVRSLQYLVKNAPDLCVLPVPDLTRDGGGILSTLAKMGLWMDWQSALGKYLDHKAARALPSTEHETVYVWLAEGDPDVVYDWMAAEFESDTTILFPGEALVILPGESWRVPCSIIREVNGTDRVYVTEADRLRVQMPAEVLERVREALGAEPGLLLWVYYRKADRKWFDRLRAVLRSHGPVHVERGDPSAVGPDRAD